MRCLSLLALAATGCTHLVWYGRSPDRRHIVAVIEEGGTQRVRLDTVDGPRVGGVALEGLVLGPGGHLAYPALVAGRWTVIHDGVAGPPFDGVGEVVLSEDGRDVAWAGQREGGWYVVHGSAIGERFEALFPGALRFSRTGRLAAAGTRGGRAFVVVDGRTSEGWDAVGQLHFSDDGQRLAYVARRGDQAFLVVDGEVRGPFGAVLAHGFGPPETMAVHDGGWRLWRAGRVSEPFASVEAVRVQGGRVAALARRDGRAWVLDDDEVRGPFDAVLPDLLRDDSGAVVFAAREGDDWFVWRGTARSGPWVKVESLRAAGSAVAFIGVRVEEDVVVVNGEARSSWDWAASLALSPDGRRVAFLARRGTASRFVVDGQEQVLDLVIEGTVAFSRDGRRAACVAGARARRQLRFVFDDGASRPLDFEELVAASALRPRDEVPRGEAGVLARWVAAELER
jgi:hypothetical protein